MRIEVLREALKDYEKRYMDPERLIKYMFRLVDLLEQHPHLGTPWGDRVDAGLRDMEDAIADLEG